MVSETKNPWIHLPSAAPFVLPEDAPFISAFNESRSEYVDDWIRGCSSTRVSSSSSPVPRTVDSWAGNCAIVRSSGGARLLCPGEFQKQ